MSKLTIIKGLPAAGKSTLAEEIVKSSGNTIRVNKDLLREMLHFNKFTGRNEETTFAIEMSIAKLCLVLGKNVVVDDTNLSPRVLNSWKSLANEVGAHYEVKDMETPMSECLERDEMRRKMGKRFVGPDVITGMAMRYGLYPKPEKGFVICDLDGTLCNIDHRLHFVQDLPEGQKKDWKSFFEGIPGDSIRMDVVDILMDLEGEGYDIFFVSGRPDTYRKQTEAWLESNFMGYRPHKALFMRKATDKRPDTEVKKSILDECFDKSLVYKVIDDRPSVIRMWRAEGLDVIDVGNGIEF